MDDQGGLGKVLLVFILGIAAFYVVDINPGVAYIMAGCAFFILFFFKSREAIIAYTIYFSFEDVVMLHAPESFVLLFRYLGDVMILAFFFSVFAKMALRHYSLEFFQENKLHLFVLLFLVSSILSAVLNTVPVDIAFVSIRQLLRYVVVFYSIVMTSREEWTQDDLKNLATIVIVLIFLQAGIGYLQLYLGPDSALTRFLSVGQMTEFGGTVIGQSVAEENRGKLLGTLVNPNTFGLFLTGGFCLILGIYLCTRKEKHNMTLLLLSMFLLYPLLKSFSRQSIYATLLGATVIGILKKELKILFITLLILGSFGYYFYQVQGESILNVEGKTTSLGQRLISPFHSQYRKRYLNSDRLFALNSFAPDFLKTKYAYFGLGPGAIGSPYGYFMKYLEGYKKMGVPIQLIPMIHIGVADVGFLSMVGQYGIVGFALFYLMFFNLFHYIHRKVLPFMEDLFCQGIALGVLGYIVALLVSNIGYANFSVRQISFYFWLLAALVCSFKRSTPHTPFVVSSTEGGKI